MPHRIRPLFDGFYLHLVVQITQADISFSVGNNTATDICQYLVFMGRIQIHRNGWGNTLIPPLQKKKTLR
jgi:hypothetical protein